MGKQVVAIHGGTSFDSYEDYINFIKTRELSLERLKQCNDWKSFLGARLGDEFEVLVPKMPNGTNVRYQEWGIWFDRCSGFFTDGVILIGHSLGGIFLAKYLSENDMTVRIGATILVAAPFEGTSTEESLADFALPPSLVKFAQQGGDIYLVYSRDDQVVPFEEADKYQQALPVAKKIIFDDRGHFNQEDFPELIELIQSI